MKPGLIAWSVLAAFTAGSAHAATYFDTVSGASQSNYSGQDGFNDAAGFLAQSFYAATPDFTNITVALNAQNTTDNHSFTVYLVADNGSSGVPGLPGAPAVQLNSNNAVTGFSTTAIILGTVNDSQLAAVGNPATLISFNVTAAQAAQVTTNSDNEYWVGIASQSSSLEWSYYMGGVGTASQAMWNTAAAPSGQTFSSSGNYQLIVSSSPAPEPTSLALLGVGLVGIGAERYRRRKRRS